MAFIETGRIVSRFSCGAASAVATKLVLADYPAERVVILNAFLTMSSSPTANAGSITLYRKGEK